MEDDQPGDTDSGPGDKSSYASMLNEEEKRSRKVRIIAFGLIIIVVAIIGIVVYYTAINSAGGRSTTTIMQNDSNHSSLVTVTASKSTTSISTIAQTLSISDLNVMYSYSGPSNTTVNGKSVSCGYATRATTMPGFQASGGSQITYLIPVDTGSYCGVTITSIKISTPGFEITSTNPKTPYYIPAQSSAEIGITIMLPQNFTYGPISLTISEN